jgi:hypothetical protein
MVNYHEKESSSNGPDILIFFSYHNGDLVFRI